MKRFLIIALLILLVGAIAYNFRFEIQNNTYRYLYKYFRNYSIEKPDAKNIKNRISQILERFKGKPFGIDVSHYQGKINFKELDSIYHTVPVSFIFIRATAGYNKRDNQFKYNWNNAKDKNIIRGAYHYYRPNENSYKQAENYIRHVVLEKGDFPPILDIEETSVVQSTASLKTGLIRWLTKIEEHYGVKPVIYTSDKFFLSYLNTSEFNKYPLWIANYNNLKSPYILSYQLWQFTDKGRIGGINHTVDLNVFNGNMDELKKMLVK